MIVNSLAAHPYTLWGRRYNSFKWRNEWYAFLKLADNDLEGPIREIICWYDRNILQCLGKDHYLTLRVRIRIVCGMINKLRLPNVTREMKIEFMECIWDTYKQMEKEWYEYYFKYIEQLPF